MALGESRGRHAYCCCLSPRLLSHLLLLLLCQVRVMFAMAIERQPSIIFMDEIDSLLSSRRCVGGDVWGVFVWGVCGGGMCVWRGCLWGGLTKGVFVCLWGRVWGGGVCVCGGVCFEVRESVYEGGLVWMGV